MNKQTCVVCGSLLTKTWKKFSTRSRLYCSNACRQRAYRERRGVVLRRVRFTRRVL
jgi:hypothetical protein